MITVAIRKIIKRRQHIFRLSNILISYLSRSTSFIFLKITCFKLQTITISFPIKNNKICISYTKYVNSTTNKMIDKKSSYFTINSISSINIELKYSINFFIFIICSFLKFIYIKRFYVKIRNIRNSYYSTIRNIIKILYIFVR